jgi:hypothetical protein
VNESRGPVTPEGVFDGLRPRAIALGIIVDLVATVIFGTALTLVLASDDIASDDDAVAESALEQAVTSPQFAVTAAIGGTICTVLGAFVGARHAGVHYLRHGAWIAAGTAAVALLTSPAAHSLSWLDWLGWLFVLPAGLLGGALAGWADRIEAEGPREDD